jgi:uncharacterized protein with PQ loop repeat
MVSRLSPVSLARAVADGGPGQAGIGRFAADIVSLMVSVLQVGQFVPQHLEMRKDKSTAGLSPWLLFFGSMYTYLAFLDIAMTDGAEVLNCGDGAYRCFISAQPLLQMLLSAALSSALWYWYLRFYATVLAASDESHIAESSLAHAFYDLLPPQLFFQLNVLVVIVVSAFALAVIVSGEITRVTTFAHFCGNVAALLNAVMWMPQIIVTAAYGHKGALSVHWVIASVVMDVVYSVYLATLGFDMSVWLNNVPDAIQTGILLCIIIYMERRDAENGRDDFGRRLSMMDRLREQLGTRAEISSLLASQDSTLPRVGNGYNAIPYSAEV